MDDHFTTNICLLFLMVIHDRAKTAPRWKIQWKNTVVVTVGAAVVIRLGDAIGVTVGEVCTGARKVGYLFRVDRPSIPHQPRENMNLRGRSRDPGAGGVDHLLQRLHWNEVRPTSRAQHGNFEVVGRSGAEPRLVGSLPLISKRRRMRKREKGESSEGSGCRKWEEELPSNCDWSVDG